MTKVYKNITYADQRRAAIMVSSHRTGVTPPRPRYADVDDSAVTTNYSSSSSGVSAMHDNCERSLHDSAASISTPPWDKH